MSSLFDDWADGVRSGIRGYLETLNGLHDGRLYHGSRRAFDRQDAGDDDTGMLLPLLWGAF